MKKVFSLIATAILAVGFTACSQSDVLEDTGFSTSATSNDNAIQFGTYMGKVASTRTTVGKTGGITTEVLHTGTGAGDGFGVFAYYTSTTSWTDNQSTFNANFMYNQKVTTDGATGWTYSPLKYWPNDISTGAVDAQTDPATGSAAGGKVSFFAYAPYVASVGNPASDDGIVGMTANTATEAPKITYRLPAKPSESTVVDLLWGMRGSAYNQAPTGAEAGSATGYNTDLTKQTVTEKVNFLFKHALARLGGSATTGNHGGVWVALDLDEVRSGSGNAGTASKDATTLVTIKSINIQNGESSVPYSFKKKGTFNLATGTWSDLDENYAISDLDSYDDATLKLNTAVAEPETGLANDGSGWKVSGEALSGVTTTLQQMYNDKDSYYLIPATTDQKLKITINYVVRTYDENLNNSGNAWSEVEQTIAKIVTFTGGLDSNKIYRLNLYLGLTSIKFTATVSNWSPDGSGDEGDEVQEVDVPLNVADVTP